MIQLLEKFEILDFLQTRNHSDLKLSSATNLTP